MANIILTEKQLEVITNEVLNDNNRAKPINESLFSFENLLLIIIQ